MERNEKISALQKTIKQQLEHFSPIFLEDLPPENQMTRYDQKFIFPSSLIPGIISELSKDYKVLEINKTKINIYQSVYYDTPDYKMYHAHHNGKSSRYKVRIRRYLNTGEQFLELKKKSNTGLMEKKRIPLENLSDINTKDKTIICENSPYTLNELQEAIKSEYSRVTFQDPEGKDRLTFDFFLKLSKWNKSISLPGLGIIEAKKTDPHTQPLISSALKNRGIFPTSFSKYCIGMAVLSEKLKYNNFKEKILTLKRFENEFDQHNDLTELV